MENNSLNCYTIYHTVITMQFVNQRVSFHKN